MVAYHSVLVFDVLGVSNFDQYQSPPEIPEDTPQPITDLFGIHRELSKKNYLESYHDALQAVDEAMSLFNLGHLTIEHRALAERLFWALCNKLLNMVRELDYVPEELQGMEALLVGHVHVQPVDLSVDARSPGRSSSFSRSCPFIA